MQKVKQNFKVQLFVAILSVGMFTTKIVAYYYTHSLAIFTDALESIVNIIAGFVGLYSIYIAAKPSDKDHPYGHGKAEFISAAVEGTLILVSGVLIIIQSVQHILFPQQINQLNSGIILLGITGGINFIVGYICNKIGKQNKSVALQASGKHLQIDTYSTIGIIVALVLVYFTHWYWLDTFVALVISVFILYNGYKILRTSLAGIMDEADTALLTEFVQLLNKNRRENWVDLHNLRVIKYGATLHIDCHLTVPWYININEAHLEIDALSTLIQNQFKSTIELFVHTDGCLPLSCSICTKADCKVRLHPFITKLNWTLDNVLVNQKHTINQ